MRRLAGMLTALVTCLCVGTILAQAIGFGYLWGTGQIDQNKLLRMLAIAQDVDLTALEQAQQKVKEIPDAPAEPSFEEFERSRNVKARYLELKQDALTKGLDQLRFAREQYSEEKDRYERVKNDFKAELAKMSGGAKSEGIAAVRLIWENIKPKLAKEQIMQMVEQDEIEDVVVILSDMPIGKRAKIVSTFTSDKEVAVMDEIMRLIRQGAPEITLIDDTLDKTGTN